MSRYCKYVLPSLLGVLSLTLSPSSQERVDDAKSSDYVQVEKTVNWYLDGGTQKDFDTLRRAFHKTAAIKSIGQQGYEEGNAIEFFRSRMKQGSPSNRRTRVVHIDVSGTAASAKLEIEYPTFTFVDYMTLLKIDGEWKIVCKVYHRRMHLADKR